MMSNFDLDPAFVYSLVRSFLAEDVGRGDVTTLATVSSDQRGRARIEARQGAVIAGLDVARACFDVTEGTAFGWEAEALDGEVVGAGQILARLEGALRTILTAERTALNLLAHLSGIATVTAAYVAAVDGTPAQIVDTRKTIPGLRVLDKWAVRVGGGRNHRFGLDDGVLVKDNHIAAAGGVTEAVRKARAGVAHGMRVQIEVGGLDELGHAVAAGADSILLDNMTPQQVRDAVAAAGGKVLLEASGGINLENVRAYADTGVDLISVGALTHSAPNIDVALEVEV
jgi:nicotinate-nucleotide pyrophosphorylase (carboxylating)